MIYADSWSVMADKSAPASMLPQAFPKADTSGGSLKHTLETIRPTHMRYLQSVLIQSHLGRVIITVSHEVFASFDTLAVITFQMYC